MNKLLSVALISVFFLGFLYKKGPQNNNVNNKIPRYDHIVIVMEENKGYDQVIENDSAPYINALKKDGANLTQMFAEEHASEGNYFWIFSGSNQNVGFNDVIPNSTNNKIFPFKSSNLAEQLIKKGYSFNGYSESLPKIGDTVSHSGYYARKHVPWISFSNIPNGNTDKTSVNLQFRKFPSDYNELPTVSFIIPNLIHDMHDPQNPEISVKNGDNWLKENLDGYYRWAKKHNSLLIITFDENADKSKYRGLTDPSSKNSDIKNRIPTIIAGAHIIRGDYPEGKGITHVNILRTIESMYGLSKSGHQQNNALKYGIKNNYIIKDIFR
jgi:phospholipase C